MLTRCPYDAITGAVEPDYCVYEGPKPGQWTTHCKPPLLLYKMAPKSGCVLRQALLVQGDPTKTRLESSIHYY